MSEEIGVRPGSEHCQERQAGRSNDPPLSRPRARTARRDDPQRSEDTEACEDGGRGADRHVTGAMDGRGERVAARTGEQQQPQADAGAKLLAHRRHEQRTREGVAEQMRRVGVQRQRGHRPPPLAGHDACRVRTPVLKPLAARRA